MLRIHPMKRKASIKAALALAWAGASILNAQCSLACPPYNPPTGPNLLVNPDFNTVGPCGPVTFWSPTNTNCGTNSAAQAWSIHSSNGGAPVQTSLVLPSTLPLGGGLSMIHIVTGGNEGGIFQVLPTGLTTVVASAWVYVRKGHVVLGTNSLNTGPYAWSTKTNEWEFLQVCSNGSVPASLFLVWNEDPAGSDFYVDKVNVQVSN